MTHKVALGCGSPSVVATVRNFRAGVAVSSVSWFALGNADRDSINTSWEGRSRATRFCQ
jgi:hypothetical protein